MTMLIFEPAIIAFVATTVAATPPAAPPSSTPSARPCGTSSPAKGFDCCFHYAIWKGPSPAGDRPTHSAPWSMAADATDERTISDVQTR